MKITDSRTFKMVLERDEEQYKVLPTAHAKRRDWAPYAGKDARAIYRRRQRSRGCVVGACECARMRGVQGGLAVVGVRSEGRAAGGLNAARIA